MSLLDTFREIPPKQLALGVLLGLVFSIGAVLVINSLFFGYPMDPAVYQYDYPNGTGPMSPLTETSIETHASGSALTTPAYAVNYSERTTYQAENGSTQTISNTTINYQVNNLESVGYLEHITTGSSTQESHYEYYETQNDSFSHYPANNSTYWQKTGETPRVLTNQIELPKTLVQSVPHINWKVANQETRNGESYITYNAVSASASQMPAFDSVTDVTGELQVSQRTNILSFEVTVNGTTTLTSGEEVTVTKTQSLDWTAVHNETVPNRPEWADDSISEGNTTENDSDSEWTPPQ